MSGPLPDVLGSWSHVHEEDHDDVHVYRPSGSGLPPSRGRESFTLREDTTAVRRTPGPADAGTGAPARWSVDGDVLRVEGPAWSAAYEIVSAGPERLELRPVDTEGGTP
jgi:hypothetical protein